MAVPEACVSWGYHFGATSYVLRVDADAAGAEDLTFNSAAAGNLDTTADYFMGGTGQAQDILYLLKLCIEKHTAGITVDVYLDSNLKVQVDLVAGTSFQIHWSHSNTTLDPELFGFAYEDTGAVTTVTSDERPVGIWRPGLPITVDDRPRDQIIGGVSMAISGKTRVSNFGTAERDRLLHWRNLAKSVVREEYADFVPEAFQYAWRQSIGLGRSFRYYPDDLSLAWSRQATHYVAALDDPMKRSGPFNLRWDVDLQCKENSSSDYASSTYSIDCSSGNKSATAPVVITGDSTWSLGFWFRKESINTEDTLLGQWQANQRCFLMKATSGNAVRILVADDLVSPSSVHRTMTSTISAQTWYHVVVTFSAGTLKMYLDGVEESLSSTGSLPSAMTASASPLGVGQDGGGSGTDSVSYFDDVCFYSKALSVFEVKVLYEGLPTEVTGLTRWWAFERDGACHVTGDRVVPYSTNPATYSTTVRS